MRFSLPSLLALIALSGCQDPDALQPDADGQSVRLASGVYDLAVLETMGTTCGARESERGVESGRGVGSEPVGAVLPVALRSRGGAVDLAFEGWRLRGDMGGRNLYVEGGPSRPDVVVVDTDEDRDDDDTVTSADGEAGESADGEAPPGGDSGRGSPDAEESDEAPRDEYAPFASLDMRIQDAHFADGRLTVSDAGCEMELHVTLTWRAEAPVEGRRGEGRPPETDEPREGDVPAEEGGADAE